MTTTVSSGTMRYEVEAHVVGPGVSRARIKASAIDFDTAAGETASLPGPADLLVTAFAACVLKNVARFAERLPFRYRGAAIHVTAEREDRPPRIARLHYVLRVNTDEPPHRVDLLHRNVAKFGTIFNTLAAACAVSGETVAERSSDSAPELA